MIRRLLEVCIGAVLVGTVAAPAVLAKLPDLPEDGTFTVAPRISQPATDDDVLRDVPVSSVALEPLCFSCGSGAPIYVHVKKEADWLKWIISHWTTRQRPPAPEQNEGYVQPIATGMDFAYRVVHEPPASENEMPAPTVEILPMPHEETDITCPYLRQQKIDRHACQIADPEIGRDVLANLESLKEADNLVELAKEMARYGFLTEAMMCCDLAAKKCPGSPCAERAIDTLSELAIGSIPPTTDTEESAEPQPDEPAGACQSDEYDRIHQRLEQSEDLKIIEEGWERIWSTDAPSDLTPKSLPGVPWRGRADVEPGVEPMVNDLMKACHLLMSKGMQHQAAELARQAFALDPQRVSADPLVYKMHLLAESPPTPAGASEESEAPTCPYCPSIGKPIREILPEKKKSKDGPTTFLVPSLPSIDYEVVPALDDELRLSADCSLGENIYHLRYKQGSLSVWTTTDASKTNK